MNKLFYGDNLDVLREHIAEGSVGGYYIQHFLRRARLPQARGWDERQAGEFVVSRVTVPSAGPESWKQFSGQGRLALGEQV